MNLSEHDKERLWREYGIRITNMVRILEYMTINGEVGPTYRQFSRMLTDFLRALKTGLEDDHGLSFADLDESIKMAKTLDKEEVARGGEVTVGCIHTLLNDLIVEVGFAVPEEEVIPSRLGENGGKG